MYKDIFYIKISELKEKYELRNKLHILTKKLREKLKANEIEVLQESATHILRVIIGNGKKCKDAAKMLFEVFNIYVQPINASTVEKGTERFRINMTPNHTDEQIDLLVSSMSFVFEHLGIKREVVQE